MLLDGQLEGLSKQGTFVGQHIYTSLQGAAVHINAFNFPVWGMLEKLAPTLLAGVPAIVKPASATAYLAEAAFKIMIEANILPPGAIQLIVGGVGDLFDHLTGQDVVSFTGSAHTALKLRTHPVVMRESVKFVAEQDSLNASLLGPDAAPGTPEFMNRIDKTVVFKTLRDEHLSQILDIELGMLAAPRTSRSCPRANCQATTSTFTPSSGRPRATSSACAHRICRR